MPEGGASHFEHLERVNAESIKGNSIYYRDLLAIFFSGIPDYKEHKGQWIAYIVTLPFVVIGLIRPIRVGHHMLIYILLTYALFVLWPHKQGLRFLFPVLPFYILFFVSGLSLIRTWKSNMDQNSNYACMCIANFICAISFWIQFYSTG